MFSACLSGYFFNACGESGKYKRRGTSTSDNACCANFWAITGPGKAGK